MSDKKRNQGQASGQSVQFFVWHGSQNLCRTTSTKHAPLCRSDSAVSLLPSNKADLKVNDESLNSHKVLPDIKGKADTIPQNIMSLSLIVEEGNNYPVL